MIAVNPMRETQRQAKNMPDEKSLGELFVPGAISLANEDKNYLYSKGDSTVNNPPSKILNDNSQFATTIIPSCRNGISILMELPLKIISGVSDLFNLHPQSSDSEIPAKRPYSPKSHHSKQTPTDVARGRGRGRGRSQLRRSGVSQARHRHERNRQRLCAEIQDDLEGLREYDELRNDEEVPGSACIDENGCRILYGADGAQTERGESKFPLMFGRSEVKRSKQKLRNKLGNRERKFISENCKVRYIRECPMEDVVSESRYEDGDEDEESESWMPVRSRLQSSCSVDSEDSCWIMFDPGSESEQETELKVMGNIK